MPFGPRRKTDYAGSRMTFERGFPKPQHSPTSQPQNPIDLLISFFVSTYFGNPKAPVRRGHSSAGRMAVPKIALTKTASLSFENTKSGLPGSLLPRRHPLIPAVRISMSRRSSVEILPRLLIADITSDLLSGVKTSAT